MTCFCETYVGSYKLHPFLIVIIAGFKFGLLRFWNSMLSLKASKVTMLFLVLWTIVIVITQCLKVGFPIFPCNINSWSCYMNISFTHLVIRLLQYCLFICPFGKGCDHTGWILFLWGQSCMFAIFTWEVLFDALLCILKTLFSKLFFLLNFLLFLSGIWLHIHWELALFRLYFFLRYLIQDYALRVLPH